MGHRSSGGRLTTLGHLLHAHRRRRGLSQEELAGRVQPALSVNTIANLERGRTRPHRGTVESLCNALALGADERAELLAAWRLAGGADPSPVAVTVARRHNLPAPLTSFIGREQELARVAGLLAGTRLLTLTGAGGSGKTRLALEAARVLDGYPDGVWLVELAPLSLTGLVPETVAAALGIPDRPGQSVVATLAVALSSWRALLLLDNCEHLVEACAQLVEGLLRACPHLTVLATSREALNIAGEATWRVPPLARDDRSVAPDLLAPSEAVRLFVDRARAVRAEFALTATTAPAVARICHRLDGLPMAIELAAARVRQLTLEEIAARLDDRFQLLTGGSRTALPRHQTLRALVDWSYDLLTRAEQTLLARLSVFAGGWTLESAEAVCADASNLIDLLGALIDKSLVVAEVQPDGAIRYHLLETLRHYAAEKLGPAERAAAESAHGEHFVALVEDGHHRYWRRGNLAWCARLDGELDNLRAVMARGLGPAERGEPAVGDALLAARLAPCLNWFWYLHGLWTEARGWLSSLARLTDLPPNVECRLLGGESRFAVEQGDLAAATALVGRSVAIAERSGDRATAAVAMGLQGLYLTRTGAPAAAARERSERSLELTMTVEPAEFLEAMQPERGWWIGMQHQARCQRAFFDGDVAEATDAGREALRAMRRLGEPLGTALALGSMALLGMRSGDLAGARTLLEEALALAHQGLPPPILADVLGHLATVTRLSGDSAGARQLLGQSLTRRRDHGLRLGAANDMVALAAVELPGDPTAAATLLAASEAIVAAVAARRRPVEQQEFAQCQRSARGALDEAAFGVASSAGADMTYEDAVRYALGRTNGRPTGQDRVPAEAGGL